MTKCSTISRLDTLLCSPAFKNNFKASVSQTEDAFENGMEE